MSKLLAAGTLAAGTLSATGDHAWAGSYHHSRPHGYHHHSHQTLHHALRRHHGHHQGHHQHRHHLDGGDVLLGFSIIGGAAVLGSVLEHPRPAPSPLPVYYHPPPQRYCVQDEVYRTLSDGRIQWGTRTRCY